MIYRDLTLDGHHAAHAAEWEERQRLANISNAVKRMFR